MRGRRRQDIPARLITPAPPVGREDAEVVATRRREVARRHDRDAREDVEPDPGAGERGSQPPLALLCVGADVLAHENRRRGRVESEPDGLPDDVPAPDDECPAPRPQRRVEIAERVEQEGDAVRRPEGGEHRVVEDEQRHDPLRLLGGSGQRRVVLDAKIAGEEDDDGRDHGQRVDRTGWARLEQGRARCGGRRRRGRRVGGRRARPAAPLRDAVHRRPPARGAALAAPLAPRRHRRPPRERRRSRSRPAATRGPRLEERDRRRAARGRRALAGDGRRRPLSPRSHERRLAAAAP